MNTSKALSIIQALANGCDPDTGGSIADGCPLQRPEIVRALHCAIEALKIADLPRNVAPWLREEDEMLLAGFNQGRSIDELAASHQRTSGAIKHRLRMLGRRRACRLKPLG